MKSSNESFGISRIGGFVIPMTGQVDRSESICQTDRPIGRIMCEMDEEDFRGFRKAGAPRPHALPSATQTFGHCHPGSFPGLESGMMYSQKYLQSMTTTLEQTQASLGSETCDLQSALTRSVEILKAVQANNGTQFFLGNGASAAFAEHMALDWTKNGGVRSQNPSSSVLLTALANDLSFQDSFATYIDRYARKGDLVVTISSSGNSENVIRAIATARKMGCGVITLSGLKPDNTSRKLGDVNYYVPARTYGIVECAHQVLLHMMIDAFMGIEEWAREGYQNMNITQFQL
jgi:D-sedoheptulose 7-phosphate isomerase